MTEASVEFGIPKPTLHRHFRGMVSKPLPGRCPVLSPDFEEMLVKHIKEMQRLLFGLTPKEVRRIAEQNKLQHIFSQKTQMAGEDWFVSFCKRRPEISVRRPEATSMSRATGFSKEVVNQFYDILKLELQKHDIDASRTWNVDESGLSSVHKPPKIMAVKGMKQVGKLTSGEHGKTTLQCSWHPTLSCTW